MFDGESRVRDVIIGIWDTYYIICIKKNIV